MYTLKALPMNQTTPEHNGPRQETLDFLKAFARCCVPGMFIQVPVARWQKAGLQNRPEAFSC